MRFLNPKGALRSALSIVLFSIISVLVETHVARAEDDHESTSPDAWYVMTVISARSGFRVSHYWSHGVRLRAHTMLGVNPITTIVSGNRYWVYDVLLGEGIEIKRSELTIKQDADRGRPFGNDFERMVQSGGERVGTESVSGIPAEVWRLTNAAGRRTIWVTTGSAPIPLRVENFNRESGESATLSYSNWASSFDISESFFVPSPAISLRKFEYEEFVSESLNGKVRSDLVLFPELLHGVRPPN
ncbi:MAG TPA: DUF2092 domain-containing protein [Myxococcales bacterium]|nr:DUF2092 domain-containing protein [Myxococcales bacterium]